MFQNKSSAILEFLFLFNGGEYVIFACPKCGALKIDDEDIKSCIEARRQHEEFLRKNEEECKKANEEYNKEEERKIGSGGKHFSSDGDVANIFNDYWGARGPDCSTERLEAA